MSSSDRDTIHLLVGEIVGIKHAGGSPDDLHRRVIKTTYRTATKQSKVDLVRSVVTLRAARRIFPFHIVAQYYIAGRLVIGWTTSLSNSTAHMTWGTLQVVITNTK